MSPRRLSDLLERDLLVDPMIHGVTADRAAALVTGDLHVHMARSAPAA